MSGTPLLILSIFSLLCCQILSPVVFFLANSALNSGTLQPQDVSATNTAKIISIVGMVLLVLGILARLAGVGVPRRSYRTEAVPVPATSALVVTIPARR